MSLPMVLPSGRLPLLSITWEVCHRSDPSSVPLLYLGESGLERKAASICKCLERWMPQSDIVSLSVICNWNSSWFSSPEHFICNCLVMKTARDKKQLNGKEGMVMMKGAKTPPTMTSTVKIPQKEAQEV